MLIYLIDSCANVAWCYSDLWCGAPRKSFVAGLVVELVVDQLDLSSQLPHYAVLVLGALLLVNLALCF